MTAGTVDQVVELAQLAGVELDPWQQQLLRRMTCAVPGCCLPGRLLPRGRRCDQHRPPPPAGAYCAPGRCYCPTTSCTRPA